MRPFWLCKLFPLLCSASTIVQAVNTCFGDIHSADSRRSSRDMCRWTVSPPLVPTCGSGQPAPWTVRQRGCHCHGWKQEMIELLRARRQHPDGRWQSALQPGLGRPLACASAALRLGLFREEQRETLVASDSEARIPIEQIAMRGR